MSDSLPLTTVEAVLNALEKCGDPRIRAINARRGAGDNQFGVNMSDIKTIAKSIKINHDLGLALWETGQIEAMLLATLIMKPKILTLEDLERMAKPVTYSWLADWFNSNIVKLNPNKEAMRLRWMKSSDPMLSRAAWSLTTERVMKNPEGLDLVDLLDRIEREMGTAHELPQWTMNYCLAEIGIRNPERRARALDIGERLGVFRDYPVSKGCTSPFAPIWIGAMVARQK